MTNQSQEDAPEASFLTILYTMATQAMIALGEIPNPMTKEPKFDERQARWHIKSLQILQEKTAGNLSEKEELALSNTLEQVTTMMDQKTADV